MDMKTDLPEGFDPDGFERLEGKAVFTTHGEWAYWLAIAPDGSFTSGRMHTDEEDFDGGREEVELFVNKGTDEPVNICMISADVENRVYLKKPPTAPR